MGKTRTRTRATSKENRVVKGEKETPDDLFKKIDQEFSFGLDVCATRKNTKVKRFFSKRDNGLKKNWQGRKKQSVICWLNPPYSEITAWLKKATLEADRGATVVCLLPLDPTTAWWFTYVATLACEVRFVGRRVKFVGEKSAAPFPSVLVVYDGNCTRRHHSLHMQHPVFFLWTYFALNPLSKFYKRKPSFRRDCSLAI